MNDLPEETENILKEQKRIERSGKLHWIHWFVVGLSLLLTVAAWQYARSQLALKVQTQFEREAEQAIELVIERMGKYEDALWGGVAAINSQSFGIDYNEWKRFSDTLHIEKKYPGINGIGVIYHVMPDEMESFLADQRKLRPDFKIYPAHDENEYFPITYIEPVETNRQAVGLDMAHESNRYEAAKKARDTGLAKITGPIVLVQDDEKTPGFLFYAPFYKSADNNTVSNRRKNFVGMVYAPFIFKKLMEGTLAQEKRRVGLKITDGENVLYNDTEETEGRTQHNPGYMKSLTLDMYGRKWNFKVWGTLSFEEQTKSSKPWVILIGGIIIDSLLLALFISLAHANQRALKFADTVTKEYQEKSEELERALAFENLILDNIPDYIFIKDSNFKIVQANPAFLQLYPVEVRHGVLGTTTVENYDEADAAEFLKQDRIALKNGYSEAEETLSFPDGETRTLLTKKVRFENKSGEKFILGIARDITAFKAAESALSQSEEKFRLAMKHSPVGKALVSPTGQWLEVNEAICKIVGYNEEELTKIDFQTITHPLDLDTDLEYVRQLLAGDIDTYSMEKRYIHKQGHMIWVILSVALIREEDGSPKYFISQIQDITDRKKAEQELIRSNKELDDFAYIASHDLKEPLRGLHNQTRFLAEDYAGKFDKDGQHKLDRIQYLTQRMEALINDLLYYSRLGRTQMDFVETDLNLVVQEIADMMADHKDLEIKILEPLPSIMCSSQQVKELYRNLISNAFKYNESDKKVIEVGFIDQADNDEHDGHIFFVRDNGIGIEEKFHDDIFKIFKRLHKKDDYGGGTGAGLTFVKKIVDKHRGRVWVESKPGKGTTFYFTLPGSEEEQNG